MGQKREPRRPARKATNARVKKAEPKPKTKQAIQGSMAVLQYHRSLHQRSGTSVGLFLPVGSGLAVRIWEWTRHRADGAVLALHAGG